MTPEEFLTVIVVSIITTIITTLLKEPLKAMAQKTFLRLRRFAWKKYIPKGYPNADLICKLKKNSIVQILNKKYVIGGLVRKTLGKKEGEQSFEFWLIWLDDELFNKWLKDRKIIEKWIKINKFKKLREKGRVVERWLEFLPYSRSRWEEKILLWADWLDEEFWGKTAPEWPDALPKKLIENQTEIHVGHITAKIIQRYASAVSHTEALWGRWSSEDTPLMEREEYNFVDAYAISIHKVKIGKREFEPLYISLEAYAEEEDFGDFAIGIRLKKNDVKILKV